MIFLKILKLTMKKYTFFHKIKRLLDFAPDLTFFQVTSSVFLSSPRRRWTWSRASPTFSSVSPSSTSCFWWAASHFLIRRKSSEKQKVSYIFSEMCFRFDVKLYLDWKFSDEISSHVQFQSLRCARSGSMVFKRWLWHHYYANIIPKWSQMTSLL